MNTYDLLHAAADHIEAHPEEFDHGRLTVGEPGCPACYFGHIGRLAGYPASARIKHVARDVLGPHADDPSGLYYMGLFDSIACEMDGGNLLYVTYHKDGTRILRHIAETRFKPQAPDWNAIATRGDIAMEEE